MSAQFQSSLKARLLGAAFACLIAIGSLTTGGPAFAQGKPATPGLTRTAEVVPSASPSSQNAPQLANVGNPAPATGPERRIALVIGNSAYENVTQLVNPSNDAREIGKFLNSAGFEVIQATDLDHDEMIQVLQDFSAKISERGPNTAVFVYYAGHGLQIAGDNYLVPVDAKISAEADVPTEAIRLVDVMATLQAVPSRFRAVVLDACRNNPFSQLKDTGNGLAIVDAPNGSIVAYSTAPGTEAFDGEGKNSPYTAAFLRLGREPNLPIEQFFKKVRVVVNDVTEGKQTPWESSSLTSDFYFFGDTAVAAATSVDPAARQASASANRPVQVAQMRTRTPRDAYNMAVAEGSVEYYQEFIRIYPYDPYCDHIRRLLAARLVAAAWHHTVVVNSPVAYRSFYSQYSDSPYGNLALKLAERPKIMPLYQPTKIMVAPQIAPQVKLTTFNGVNVGQGNNAPIGLGGNGSLFNKKIQFGNGGPGNGGLGNQGIGQKLGLPGSGGPANQGIGQKLGLPGNGPQGNPIGNNGGRILQGNGQKPGIDFAKDAKRIDTKIDGGRLTTLPQNGNGPLVNKDKVLNGNTGINGKIGNVGNGNTGINGRIGNVGNGNTGINGRIGNLGDRIKSTGNVNPAGPTNGQPLIKRFDRPRVTNLPAKQMQTPVVKRYQPGQRFIGNGGGFGGSGGGNGGGMQFRAKPMSFGGGSSMGGGGSSGRFASGGGMGFGRSFR
jgi:uncharacterized caspase-like protein